MNAARTTSVGSVLVLTFWTLNCSRASSWWVDPQQPSPPPQKGQPLRPSQIVICPNGSSYDPVHNTCIAGDASTASTRQKNPDSNVQVKCQFRNGWVSVIPMADYPTDDSRLMSALIAFAEDPLRAARQGEYAYLEPYAARRCSEKSERFDLMAGQYFMVVGERDRSLRGRNGYRRRIKLSPSAPEFIDVTRSMLNQTWE